MCVPKKRRSKAMIRQRRASFYYLDPLNVGECPQCHEPKMPHRVCPNCGFYNGRDVLKLDQDEE